MPHSTNQAYHQWGFRTTYLKGSLEILAARKSNPLESCLMMRKEEGCGDCNACVPFFWIIACTYGWLCQKSIRSFEAVLHVAAGLIQAGLFRALNDSSGSGNVRQPTASFLAVEILAHPSVGGF